MRKSSPELDEYIKGLPEGSVKTIYNTAMSLQVLNGWMDSGMDKQVVDNIFYALLVKFIANEGIESFIVLVKESLNFLVGVERMDEEYASYLLGKFDSILKKNDSYKEMYQ